MKDLLVRQRVAALLTVLIASSTIAAAPATAPSSPAARYDAAFLAGDAQTIWDHASPDLRKALVSAETFKSRCDTLLGPRPVAKELTTSTAHGAETLVRTLTTTDGKPLKVTWLVNAKTAQILGLLILPDVPVAPAIEAAPPSDDQIKATVQKCVDTYRLAPGIVVGLIDDKGTRVFAYGRRELGKPDPITPNTLFEIGSVTKVFTTTLLQEMADRGDVKLDDPISKYLPPTVTTPTRKTKQITLQDLATHTSGLPSAPSSAPFADGDDPWADFTVPLLYDFLSTYTLPRNIGAKYEYSNLGVGLLGHLLGLAAKSDYESLVTQHICTPLQMNDTRITLTPGQKSRLATGHSPSGPPVRNWSSNALLADGALFSTASDMLKFLSAHMGKTPASPLTAAMAKTHRVRHAAGDPFTKVALGWHVTSVFGQETATWHNGETGGYHAYLAFKPKLHRGVVVLANSANSIDDLADYVLGESDSFDAPTVPKQRTPVPLDASTLDRYTGHYSPNITITRNADQLAIQKAGESRFQLLPESPTDFFCTAVDAQVTFAADPAGQVTHLILHDEGKDQKAEKLK